MRTTDNTAAGAHAVISTVVSLITTWMQGHPFLQGVSGMMALMISNWGAPFQATHDFVVLDQSHEPNYEWEPDFRDEDLVCLGIPEFDQDQESLFAYNISDPGSDTIHEGDEYCIPVDYDWGEPGDHSGPNGDEPDAPTPEEWSQLFPGLPYPGTAQSVPVPIERFTVQITDRGWFSVE